MPEIEELLSSIYRFNDEVNEMMSPSLFVSDKIGLSFHIIGMLRKIKRKEQIPHFEKGMVSFPQDKYIVPKIKNLFLDYFREHLEDDQRGHAEPCRLCLLGPKCVLHSERLAHNCII